MTLKSRTSPSPVSSTTPFKRGRSRVFYASDDPTLPAISSKLTNADTKNKRETIFVVSENAEDNKVQAPPWGPVLDPCKETSEANSSGDEGASPTSSSSSIRSPVGSLRSSVGGSLRGSQDSGYSDSGESNCGGSPEIDSEEYPPRVKHISRVFFGGNSGSGRARLYSDTIVATSAPISLPINPRISNDKCNSLPRRQKVSVNVEGSLIETQSNLRSSPTSICDSDEPQFQMECKSLLDISNNSYDEQASRKTGAIRKASYVTSHRKGPRRSTSADKLLDDPKPRRSCILKGRRRWSTVDVKSTNIGCSGLQSLPFMSDSRDADADLQLHSLQGPGLPLKPILTEHCLPGSQPKKISNKRLRIHPTALAAEMK